MTFSERLCEYRNHPRALKFTLAYDPNDGTHHNYNYLYALSLDHAVSLASSICREFSLRSCRVLRSAC